MDSIRRKVALLTGAAGGLGVEMARALAQEGVDLALSGRGERALQGLAEKLRGRGVRCEPIPGDLRDPQQVAALVGRAERALGPVDILVNNAAVTYFLPADTFPEKRFRLMVEVQVWAALELAQLVIPSMRAAGAGWILNISSRAAVNPEGPPFEPFVAKSGSSVYGLCKAALERLSLGMAAELHRDRIAVNTLAPWDNVATPGAGVHDLVENFPLEPEELIAEAALQLCTGDPERLTGRIAYSQSLLAELGVQPRSLSGGPFADR
jgi:citronellol/citronellal dehydrogenase